MLALASRRNNIMNGKLLLYYMILLYYYRFLFVRLIFLLHCKLQSDLNNKIAITKVLTCFFFFYYNFFFFFWMRLAFYSYLVYLRRNLNKRSVIYKL